MPRYITTLRAVYNAEDDVEAIYIAEQIRSNGASDLDEEDGDSLDVTQTTSNAIDLSPEETINQLRLARNLLIRTRIKQCFYLAKELDQTLYALIHRDESGFSMGGYSHGDFMDLALKVLDGENPDE